MIKICISVTSHALDPTPDPCHKLSHLLGPPSSVTYFMDGPLGRNYLLNNKACLTWTLLLDHTLSNLTHSDLNLPNGTLSCLTLLYLAWIRIASPRCDMAWFDLTWPVISTEWSLFFAALCADGVVLRLQWNGRRLPHVETLALAHLCSKAVHLRR